jgi:transposase
LDANPTFGVFCMTKYDENLKLQIVRQYGSGRYSLEELSRRHKLAESLIKRWVGRYRHHGVSGLRRKYGSYDGQFKLSVLQHMRQNGLSRQETAALFDLRGNGVVGQWERQYDEGGLDRLEPKPRGRPKTMIDPPRPPKAQSPQSDDTRSREQLLEEVEYLRAEVAYLKKLRALLQAKEQAARKKRG